MEAKHSTFFQEDGTLFQMIHYATLKKSKKLVQVLLKYEPKSINAQDQEGNTPLHYACYYRLSGMVAMLIQEGAEVNIQNNSQRVPLHIAIH